MALAGVFRSCARDFSRPYRRRRLACTLVGLCTFDNTQLLLLRLTLEVLVGTECERTTDQDDSVQTDTSRGAVSRRGGGAGLCVALGLGVAILSPCQLILSHAIWCM